MRTLLLFLLVSLILSCTRKQEQQTTSESHLGDLQHDFSISEEAKPYFDEGLLLLHSFEYVDAREQFEKAREAAPDEVMAYWGLAMTHYRALWGLQNMERSLELMRKYVKKTIDSFEVGRRG